MTTTNHLFSQPRDYINGRSNTQIFSKNTPVKTHLVKEPDSALDYFDGHLDHKQSGIKYKF